MALHFFNNYAGRVLARLTVDTVPQLRASLTRPAIFIPTTGSK